MLKILLAKTDGIRIVNMKVSLIDTVHMSSMKKTLFRSMYRTAFVFYYFEIIILKEKKNISFSPLPKAIKAST